ncbi:MAG: hypothetical protein K2X37_00700 [Chitinophagaceae bacterium]|nr:hypothetical protein [Chitinophagaceae bacterium]
MEKMMEVLNMKNPHINGFADQNDPEALLYLDKLKAVKDALGAGRLYCRYIDGDRKGSVAKLIPDPAYSHLKDEDPAIRHSYSSWQKGPWFCFENDMFFMIATWNSRKNKVKETWSYYSQFEFIIGDDVETVWEKFDAKAAKEEVLKNPDQKDIDGNILKVDDNVMFINARYGSRMVLERGRIKEFKVVVDSKKTSISTVIENGEGALSTLSYPEDMVCRI